MKNYGPNDPGYVELRQCGHVVELGAIRLTCTKPLGHDDDHQGRVTWQNQSDAALRDKFLPVGGRS